MLSVLDLCYRKNLLFSVELKMVYSIFLCKNLITVVVEVEERKHLCHKNSKELIKVQLQ